MITGPGNAQIQPPDALVGLEILVCHVLLPVCGRTSRRAPGHSGAAKTMASADGFAIMVNGEQVTTRAATLADLLADRSLADRKVATAHNGDFVPERARGEVRLKAGDRIEIVSPRQGG